jgi:hypothetical protein
MRQARCQPHWTPIYHHCETVTESLATDSQLTEFQVTESKLSLPLALPTVDILGAVVAHRVHLCRVTLMSRSLTSRDVALSHSYLKRGWLLMEKASSCWVDLTFLGPMLALVVTTFNKQFS